MFSVRSRSKSFPNRIRASLSLNDTDYYRSFSVSRCSFVVSNLCFELSVHVDLPICTPSVIYMIDLGSLK